MSPLFPPSESKFGPLTLLVAAMMMCGLISAEGQAPVGSSQNSSDPLQEHYRAAATALANDDQQHAALEYKAFLAEALHRAANAEAQIGEAARASEHFAQALEFEPQDSALLDDYASLCFDRNELAKSESLLKDALTVNQSDTRAHFLLGRILFNQEKYLAAKPHLQAAFSTDREAWYLLGITYLKLQDLNSAQELFKRMVATLGEKASTHFRLGMAYYTGDYPDEAITEFKRAITQDSRAPDQHYYLGLAYLGHNPEAGFAKADPEFRAELALSPNDFRGHYMLGYIALKQNRLQEADRELTKARTLQPDDQNMLLLMAELYGDLGRVVDAEPLLRKVIVLAGISSANYEIIRAHYMLGRILQRTGKEDEAKKELALSEELRRQFREASGSTPKERADPGLRNSQSPTPAKTVSPEERANAEAFLRGLSSPIAEAFNNLGAMAATKHQCPDCVNYFKHAGEWEPSLDGIDRNLGRAAFLCNLYGDAVPPLSRYLENHASDATARSALGLSLFHIGEYQKVIEILDPIKSAVESNPELSNAYATARAKIKQ